jgi:O-antigen/teichoic acid export membrane protein
MEQSRVFLVVQTSGTVFVLALNIYFIAVLKMGLGGFLWSSVLMTGIQMALLCGWLVRAVGMHFRMDELRQILKYGWPLTFANLAVFTLNFSDRFFLQHLRSLDEVGVYAVGYKFGFIMNFLLIAPFVTMWHPRMFSIHAQSDHPRIFGRIFALYSFLLMYAGLGLSILSPEMLRFMVAREFYSGQQVVPLVAFAYVFWGIGFYAQLGLYLTNRTGLIGTVGVGAAILNIVLNYFLILHYGMMGAAWATLLSFVAIAAASYWLSQHVLPLPLSLGRVVAGLVLCMALYSIPRWWSVGSLGVILAEKVLLLAVFPVLLWKTGILSQGEMGTLVELRDSVLAKLSRTTG